MENFLTVGYSIWGEAKSAVLFLMDALIFLTLAFLRYCAVFLSDTLYHLAQSIAYIMPHN